MFAIDGVKLPSNASKERSATHQELRHRAQRVDKAAAKIVELHQAQDHPSAQQPLHAKRQARIDALRQEAQRTREFLSTNSKRVNRKGQELKTNVTDPDSAKMATRKGVIQGYAAQAAVDGAHPSHRGGRRHRLRLRARDAAAHDRAMPAGSGRAHPHHRRRGDTTAMPTCMR